MDSKEQLTELFNKLQIKIVCSEPGVFTAYTNSEPLFCFDSSSVEELKDLIFNTLVSYVELVTAQKGAD